MLRKILILAGYFLLVVFMVGTMVFAAHESKNICCGEIQISQRPDEMIRIGNDEIKRLVLAADKQVVGKELRLINAEVIEQEIEKHQAIEKAEVFKKVVTDSTSYKGIVGVRIKHREPVVRIMSVNGRYYLDKSGEKIPVSSRYTAKVLVATGNFSEEYARKELLPFVLFLNESPFWRAQIEQIHIDANGGVLLTPLVGDQIIEFGSLVEYQEKLQNLKAFYEQVLSHNNWDKYKTINLKYRNQVIAKKR